MTRKCDALGHALLCSMLSSMLDCESLFLFALQQFPWQVRENTGLLLLFGTPLLTFNVWHLYLRENVLMFLFVLWEGEEHSYVFFAVVASSLLAFSFLTPLAAALCCVQSGILGKSHQLSWGCVGIFCCMNRVESTVTDKPYVHEKGSSTSRWDAQATDALKFNQCLQRDF